ncbi:hypothetical protein FBZ89_1198 [Nitrospirillum amazonense]|uniref:Uncharacterized protein n=1 Tax=Nitrospirillum amazonense TaxID=28077 RepID=A0A560EWR5_9PROT|nr:hypothetical protein FBZ89_1198 [Nitrospirillum amazonense]
MKLGNIQPLHLHNLREFFSGIAIRKGGTSRGHPALLSPAARTGHTNGAQRGVLVVVVVVLVLPYPSVWVAWRSTTLPSGVSTLLPLRVILVPSG